MRPPTWKGALVFGAVLAIRSSGTVTVADAAGAKAQAGISLGISTSCKVQTAAATASCG